MKKDTDELHQLVSSLTLSEKRYCSLYLQKHAATDDNRYLKLFNGLVQQREYNAALIMKEMHYEKKPGHYSVLKTQLYEQLLDALHQFALFTNPEQQLFRGIHQCSLLLKKDLHKQAEKKFDALCKTAVATGNNEALMMLQKVKKSIMSSKRYHQVSEDDINKWHGQTQEIIATMEISSRYAWLNAQVFRIQSEGGIRSQKGAASIKSFIESPGVSGDKNTLTLRAKMDYYEAMAAYYHQNLETQKSLEYFEAILSLLNNDTAIALYRSTYQVTQANYLICALGLRKYDLFLKGLEKFKSLPRMPVLKRFDNPDLDSFIFSVSSSLEIQYLINTNQLPVAHLKVKEINAGLKKFGGKIAKYSRIALLYNTAYACFGVSKYDDALDQVIAISREKESSVAEEIQLMARMMQLVCHFEKGDKLLLDSLVKSLQRSLREKDQSVDILREVLSFINSSITKTNIEQKYWYELQNKINKLSANKAATGFLGLFDYKVWIWAKIEGISFAEAWNKRDTF